jgi:hypothetical protein
MVEAQILAHHYLITLVEINERPLNCRQARNQLRQCINIISKAEKSPRSTSLVALAVAVALIPIHILLTVHFILDPSIVEGLTLLLDVPSTTLLLILKVQETLKPILSLLTGPMRPRTTCHQLLINARVGHMVYLHHLLSLYDLYSRKTLTIRFI